MTDDMTCDDAPRISDIDKSYYLRRAAAESSTAAQAANPVAAEIHIVLALAYLHRVLGREHDRTNDARRGGRSR